MADVTKINGYIIKDANAPHPSNTGSAGQILKKTETGTEWADASVPDWNQNDETAADYIKNRPFYTGDPVETVLIEESTVPFTDIGDLFTGAIESTFSPTVGETYKVYWDGADYESTCVKVGRYTYIGNLSIDGSGPDTGEPFLMNVTNQAISVATLDYASYHTISISEFVPGVVVKIDKKYLVQPDWNQNDSTAVDYVKNRPFYTGDPVETVLVEESTVAFALHEASGLYLADFPSTFEATIGKTYKISWDGTAYECVCSSFQSIPVIGNLSIAGAGSDTGEPFLMMVSNGEAIQIGTADTSSSHTFSISGMVAPVVKIDKKYIPDNPFNITGAAVGQIARISAVDADGNPTEWETAYISSKPAGKSYLTFSSPTNFTLKVNDSTKHWDGTIEYFTSDKTWTTWDGTTILSAVFDDGAYVLYLRGTRNTVITGNSLTCRWVLTGTDVKCNGNIEDLLDYERVTAGAHPSMKKHCYFYMFYHCTSLTQAPTLPATTLVNGCYQGMFQGCSSLTQAPTLPATTLTNYCYKCMFQDCTSLTQAPALSATRLGAGCYDSMFRGCTSLTQAPALPATKSEIGCYQGMFRGCTSLTQAPALPATKLEDGCYQGMFYGCTSLTQAPALPATTLANNCCHQMFQGCIKIKLSSTQTGEYTQEYRIPSSGTGTTATDALANMFTSTGGTFTGTPNINTTYYLSTNNMVVRETEIATLNGYVGSMIEGLATQEYVDGKVPNDGTTGQILKKTETGTEWADEKNNKAVAFTVTLSASGWSGKAQTVSDARFLTGNYAYSVAPDSGSFAAYGKSTIYADNVTTAGQMQFHCGEVPTSDLTVNILRMEVSA